MSPDIAWYARWLCGAQGGCRNLTGALLSTENIVKHMPASEITWIIAMASGKIHEGFSKCVEEGGALEEDDE